MKIKMQCTIVSEMKGGLFTAEFSIIDKDGSICKDSNEVVQPCAEFYIGSMKAQHFVAGKEYLVDIKEYESGLE